MDVRFWEVTTVTVLFLYRPVLSRGHLKLTRCW